MIGTLKRGILVIDLAYKITTGPTQLGNDIGMTLVADGNIAKITPLSVETFHHQLVLENWNLKIISPIWQPVNLMKSMLS